MAAAPFLAIGAAITTLLLIFDDIYWSMEMNEAWKTIQAHNSVTLTLDVYQMGICFFMKEKLAKENFVLRY